MNTRHLIQLPENKALPSLTIELESSSGERDLTQLRQEILFLSEELSSLAATDLSSLLGRYALSRSGAELCFSFCSVSSAQKVLWQAPFTQIQLAQEKSTFGRVDIVAEDASWGVYRLRIAPGAGIPAHFHQAMDEAELILDNGLLLQNKEVAAGSAFHWPKNFVHAYHNPSAVEKTILCIDRPKFLKHDEILDLKAELLSTTPHKLYW